MQTIPSGFCPNEWNQAFGAFKRLIEHLDALSFMLAECGILNTENSDVEYTRTQIFESVETLRFLTGEAEQRWKALCSSVTVAVGKLNLIRPADDVAWCSSLLNAAWTLHNGLRRELAGENAELCIQRLPLHVSRIPNDINQWRDRITAELRAGSMCADLPTEDGELVTVEDVAARCVDVEAKTLLNDDVKTWGPHAQKIGRSRAWYWHKILPMVTKKRRLKPD